MEFVEEQDSNLAEQGVILDPAQEDAFGDEAEEGGRAELIIETDLVTDLGTEWGLAFKGHSSGD